MPIQLKTNGMAFKDTDGTYKQFDAIKGSSSYNDLTDKPNFKTVATSGSYNDLSDKPTIPTNNNQLTNGAGYTKNAGTVTSVAVKMNGTVKGTVTSSGTIDLGTVATSGGFPGLDTSKIIATKSWSNAGSHSNELMFTASQDGWVVKNINDWNGHGMLKIEGITVSFDNLPYDMFPVKSGQKVYLNGNCGGGNVYLYGIKY